MSNSNSEKKPNHTRTIVAIKTQILSKHLCVSIMTVNNTQSIDADSSSETRSVFFCPKSPDFIWDLSHTTSLKIILAVITIACPVTILLNLLVIIAVKTRRELKKNSNILLSSLAVADLLVGAVSMPLSITLDALILREILFKDIVCTINTITEFVLFTLFGASFFHLVLIAWERYIAVVKWMKYKVIVTKESIKKYAAVAWLSAFLTFLPILIMEAVRVRYEVMLAVDVIVSTFWVVCFLFIIYCYVKVYLCVRKHNRTQIRSVNSLVRSKFEAKLAYTTFCLTLVVGISGIPTIIVYLYGRVSPMFRESSIFRWADTMLQLNSLVNPLLYFYRNRQLRKAALELLRCRKPQRIQPVVRMRRRRYSVASPGDGELQIVQEGPHLIRPAPCDAVMCSDTVRQESNDTVKERPMVAPTKTANEKVFTQQRNKHVVTVQIEKAPRKKGITVLPKDTTELWSSRHRMVGKIERSTSLNENSFVTLANCHQIASERNFKRSRSLPMLSTNLNTLDNKLTVAELSKEKEPAWNSYEDTKL